MWWVCGQILTNDKIPMSWRQPYLRFLLWAYVNADTESEKYNMNDLQYESALWTFLEMLAKHISSVANQVLQQVTVLAPRAAYHGVLVDAAGIATIAPPPHPSTPLGHFQDGAHGGRSRRGRHDL